jgi:hypothetical protein
LKAPAGTEMSSRGFSVKSFFLVRFGVGGFMTKELNESKITQQDIEKARLQIEDVEYLSYICDQYEACIFYDEYSNDEEGYVQKSSSR